MHKNQPEITFSKIVQFIARPEMKDASTQYKTKDCKITTSTKVIESKVKSTSKSPCPCHLGVEIGGCFALVAGG